jgi:hypothetical protein
MVNKIFCPEFGPCVLAAALIRAANADSPVVRKCNAAALESEMVNFTLSMSSPLFPLSTLAPYCKKSVFIYVHPWLKSGNKRPQYLSLRKAMQGYASVLTPPGGASPINSNQPSQLKKQTENKLK